MNACPASSPLTLSAPPCTQTPAFNFSPSSAPAFGASGAGLAKTSSTPLFGATTTTTTTAFGAAPTPGLFGSSSAPTFSFGGAQPAATQPSLFGAAQPAAAPAASPFSFGGGFGAAPAAQPAAGLFGQPATQQQQQQQAGAISPFGFGAPGGAAAPQVPDDSALKELQSVKDAYVAGPANHRYRFQYLFLNKVDNPAARVKPADVDELAWREALRRAGGEHNPDNLWPVAAHGFQDLLQRKAAQDAAMREHEERLERLQQMVAALAQRQQAVLREQLDGVKRRHAELCKQLLRVLRYVSAPPAVRLAVHVALLSLDSRLAPAQLVGRCPARAPPAAPACSAD